MFPLCDAHASGATALPPTATQPTGAAAGHPAIHVVNTHDSVHRIAYELVVSRSIQIGSWSSYRELHCPVT
eukprot:3343167-Prymnesium_polylepis.1